MLFNSFSFLVFFPIVVGLYFLLPYRFRWALLLLASCYFYMAFVPKYILILGFTIVVDYFAGILIERAEPKNKKIFLIASICANVGVLAFYKYFNFLSGNLTDLVQFLGWNYSLPLLKIILPIGLSFHTFQAMSYTIEVYRGNQKAERNFGIYALYVMFFPQLVAGPIERPQNLLHQFYERHDFEYDRVTRGLSLMLWGFFKKVVIADRLAVFVNQVFSSVDSHMGPTLLLAMFFFAYQIYCDFSGYSDIAIGSAEVLGFRLMTNFNRPYASKTISEFWSRWHISLSTWFKDYVYIPLGGNRVSYLKWCRNILVVFLLSGLWHGASWTYVVWGGLQGAMIILGRLTEKFWEKIPNSLNIIVTFVLSGIAWVFFRADSFGQAGYILTHALVGLSGFLVATFWTREILLSFLLIVVLELIQRWHGDSKFSERVSREPAWFRWGSYYALIICILFLAVRSGQQFIYFQF